MNVRLLKAGGKPPMELLLLADPSQSMVEAYIDKGECFVAEEDDQVVGVYVLMSSGSETVEIINLAVAEEHQGKGFGRALLMDAIQQAKRQGYKTIEIGTGNSSIGQLALYQKCGFRITSIDRDFFIRHYEEKIYENGIQCMDMVRLSQAL
ncbi:GNAT family N-acetyltransferase [Pradoshia sp.]